MKNSKYKSILSLINRIMRNPYMESLNESDIAEYVSEALRLIDAPLVYTNKIEVLEIKNSRAELPCDMIYINQTRRRGTDNHVNSTEAMFYSTDHFDSAYHSDSCPDLKKPKTDTDNTYAIQKGFIYTGFSTGTLELSYKGLELDDDGYPMIPDNIKVEKAVEAYIKVQHYTILWELGKIADKVMNKAEQEYAWYVGAAETSMRSLSIDQMESLKASLTRTILRPLQHHSGFKDLGTQEYINKGSI